MQLLNISLLCNQVQLQLLNGSSNTLVSCQADISRKINKASYGCSFGFRLSFMNTRNLKKHMKFKADLYRQYSYFSHVNVYRQYSYFSHVRRYQNRISIFRIQCCIFPQQTRVNIIILFDICRISFFLFFLLFLFAYFQYN